ncbi:uncharacterized protein LOC134830191 [Culicoides brevitarsis]|uniref:uncharacterized protein LOC134830191 n=1 Tax=Culicoides brevitarsis TaxID=469753 RepID=UPI00307BA2C1
MANLKTDLDQYLLLQSDQKKTNFSIPKISTPTFRWFRRDPENSWLQQDGQQECCPKLTRIQRILGFLIFMGLGVFCMILSTIYIPVLVLKARKFALLYTMGSLCFIISFSFLSGFKTMLKQIFAREKLFVSISYVLCLILTLYFAIFLQSTPLTVLAAVAQVIFLFLNIVAMVPGGTSGIKFFGQMFKSSVSNTLPV